MAWFLVKTEPTEYSWDDLVRDGATVWSGVTNNAALLHMRAMKAGDEVFLYHTGNERAIVGLGTVARAPYPDPSLRPAGPKRVVVDLKPKKKANTPVSLASIKADGRFGAFALVQQPRLSVLPASPSVAAALKTLAGL